jgi:hypothetical protein
VEFYHTDLGNEEPWHFYLGAFPEIVGGWILLFPFVIWHGVGRLRARAAAGEREIYLYLFLWAFLPAFLLSFSGIKERTYILPSYGACALLVARWLETMLKGAGSERWRGVGWLGLLFPFGFYSMVYGGHTSPVVFIGVAGAAIASLVVYAVWLFFKRRYTVCAFLGMAILCGINVISGAEVVAYTKFEKRCYYALAHEVIQLAGDHRIYVHLPDDRLRGSVAFYRNRTTPELDRPEELRLVLASDERVFVVMLSYYYELLMQYSLLDGPHFLVPGLHCVTHADHVVVTNLPSGEGARANEVIPVEVRDAVIAGAQQEGTNGDG